MIGEPRLPARPGGLPLVRDAPRGPASVRARRPTSTSRCGPRETAASKAKISSAKPRQSATTAQRRIYVLRGDGNRLARLWRQQQVGGEPSNSDSNQIFFDPVHHTVRQDADVEARLGAVGQACRACRAGHLCNCAQKRRRPLYANRLAARRFHPDPNLPPATHTVTCASGISLRLTSNDEKVSRPAGDLRRRDLAFGAGAPFVGRHLDVHLSGRLERR